MRNAWDVLKRRELIYTREANISYSKICEKYIPEDDPKDNPEGSLLASHVATLLLLRHPGRRICQNPLADGLSTGSFRLHISVYSLKLNVKCQTLSESITEIIYTSGILLTQKGIL